MDPLPRKDELRQPKYVGGQNDEWEKNVLNFQDESVSVFRYGRASPLINHFIRLPPVLAVFVLLIIISQELRKVSMCPRCIFERLSNTYMMRDFFL